MQAYPCIFPIGCTDVYTSSFFLDLLLVNTGFFFFDIFLTFRIFFTLTSGSLSAYSSLTVLDHIFIGLEFSVSALSSSRSILTCLLAS